MNRLDLGAPLLWGGHELAVAGLGTAVLLLLTLWLLSRWAVARVAEETKALAAVVAAAKVRIGELEGTRLAADPEARVRQDRELVGLLRAILSYSEGVSDGRRGATRSTVAIPEGTEPWV